nr:MAG TPA: hypothetical protein [Caudoviricetes sp.]
MLQDYIEESEINAQSSRKRLVLPRQREKVE